MKKRRKEEGITLIALVLTIIVLLILAGVTIAALSGDNGILRRATESKSKTEKESTLERIKLAIMTATTKGLGVPDKTVLRNELTKAGFVVKTEGDDLPWEATSGKNIFTINEDLTIDQVSGIGLSKKEVKLFNGESETITASLTEGVSGTITWESSNTNVAKVENGKITATGTSGEATITAKVSGTDYEATCKVKIIQKVTAISASNITVGKKQTGKIQVTTTPSGEVEDLIYTSEGKNIATVAEDGTVTGIEEGTTTITIKGKISTNVSTTCTVTVTKARVSLTAAQIAANKEKYYGQVAQNYTAGGGRYRIFYVDTENKFGDGANTVYLKADVFMKIYIKNYITYIPEGNDLSVYKRMNPDWSAQRGNITPASWNDNERVAGWLCSPSQWTTFLDNTKARYAIGGPSAEMYVASYNDVPHSTENYKLGAKYGALNTPGYTYTLNGTQSTISNDDYSTGADSFDSIGYNGMYGKYWWLTSPSSRGTNFVCYVSYSYLTYNHYANQDGVGPLVALKPGIPVEVEE